MDRLLTIDDEPAICELIKHVAEDLGYAVEATSDPDVFRETLRAFDPTLVVLDLHMPRADGIELLRHLADTGSRAQILVVSGADTKVLDTVKRLGRAQGLDVLATLQKPLLMPRLESVLRSTLQSNRILSAATLSAAIANHEITPFYQPKATRGGDDNWVVDGVEALARWNHPRLGIVPPNRFIPLAEESDLISLLTYAIFRDAVEQARRWRDDGLTLKVALNLSPRLLDDLRLPDELSKITEENQVAPADVIVEVTESGVMADAARAMEILSRLRIKGFRLSIDDFGTGYSSLVQLYRLPFNEMKIDRSFVNEVMDNAEAKTIVCSILGLARNLGLASCAEGVERPETLNFLAAQGCDAAQGFWIGKPLPASEVVPLVRRWNGSRP